MSGGSERERLARIIHEYECGEIACDEAGDNAIWDALETEHRDVHLSTADAALAHVAEERAKAVADAVFDGDSRLEAERLKHAATQESLDCCAKRVAALAEERARLVAALREEHELSWLRIGKRYAKEHFANPRDCATCALLADPAAAPLAAAPGPLVAQAEADALIGAKLWDYVWEEAREGGDIEGPDVLEFAESLGLVAREPYSEDRHGTDALDVEPGDDIWVHTHLSVRLIARINRALLADPAAATPDDEIDQVWAHTIEDCALIAEAHGAASAAEAIRAKLVANATPDATGGGA